MESFISSKNSDETHTMHSKNDNVEIMRGNETYEIIEEPFEALTKISRRIRRINEKK